MSEASVQYKRNNNHSRSDMYDTYVINLKRDIARFYHLQSEMRKRGISIKRFDAIYGKEIQNFKMYEKHLSKYCQYFCPLGLIGCGLSHLSLLDQIYTARTARRTNSLDQESGTSQKPFTLVLEDDVRPIFTNKSEIDRAILNMPKDCDILLLFCSGLCGYESGDEYLKPNNKWFGSTAAYVIRNSSIPKFIRSKLKFHIDIQWYRNNKIKTCIYNKPLFITNENDSYNRDQSKNDLMLNTLDDTFKLDNALPSNMLKFKAFRIPYMNLEMAWVDILKVILTVTLLLVLIRISRKNQ